MTKYWIRQGATAMMRRYSIVLVSILVFGCSHGSTSVLQTGDVQSHIIQKPGNTDWQTFSIPQPQTNLNGMTTGPDDEVWMASYGTVFHFNVAKGKVIHKFTGLDTGTGAIATGSDGNLWMCGNGDITKLTPDGQSTVYAIPDDCTAVVAGPDGSMWYPGGDVVGRITTDGSLTRIPAPANEQIADVVVGKDGNIWAAELGSHSTGGYPAIAKIDINTFAITEYKRELPGDTGFDQIYSDTRGNLWAITGSYVVFRFEPTGVWKKFVLGLGKPLKPGNRTALYFADDSGGIKWTFAGTQRVNYGLPPDRSGFPAYTAMVGPDYNVWFWNGPTLSIFCHRLLRVSPTSATLTVGGMQTFTISEVNCNQCIWHARSSDPSVATHSTIHRKQFTVTGLSPGTATISVSDRAQNVFDVQITVQ